MQLFEFATIKLFSVFLSRLMIKTIIVPSLHTASMQIWSEGLCDTMCFVLWHSKDHRQTQIKTERDEEKSARLPVFPLFFLCHMGSHVSRTRCLHTHTHTHTHMHTYFNRHMQRRDVSWLWWDQHIELEMHRGWFIEIPLRLHCLLLHI